MLALLPWEKWLPPYVFGPLMCVGCGCVLMFGHNLAWWEILSCGFGVLFGASGTWVWYSTGHNIFYTSVPKTDPGQGTKSG
jgi:hypothetical protein